MSLSLEFWLQLGLALLLLPLGMIVQEAYGARFSAWRNQRRRRRNLASLFKAREQFQLIYRLNSDTHSTIIYFARLFAYLHVWTVGSLVTFVAWVGTVSKELKPTGWLVRNLGDWAYVVDRSMSVFMLLMMTLAFLAMMRAGTRIGDTAWQLEQPEEYRKQLIDRWPDEHWPLIAAIARHNMHRCGDFCGDSL
jgi:hypothetical protein